MEHGPEIDRLTRIMIDFKEKNEAMKIEDPSEEEILGLKYRKGEVLRDTVTGKEVTVLGGKRAFGTIPGT